MYVVGVDATQTPRSSRKLEGSGWLRNLRTPPFMVGIHAAQRRFNGSWLMPAEQGYSRAVPIRWMPAFTEKSHPQEHEACKEWEATVAFSMWLRCQLSEHGRDRQPILMVGDGSYDNLNLWKHLPEHVILLARSAKNRVLSELPDATMHKNRKYGQRAPKPQDIWQDKTTSWQPLEIEVRGKKRQNKYGKLDRRQPLPFLVNAVQDDCGQWQLPLPVDTLLFWAWQRWELEVCHRELKSNFGLGNKQCFNPYSAVLFVQWSTWVYSLLLLAGYRTWGLWGAPEVPTRWWRGSQRWSLNTLWRAYRSALWGQHDFHPLCTPTPGDWGEKETHLRALYNSIFTSARS